MASIDISDPQPAMQEHQAHDRNAKRNKILIAVGAGALVLGGVGAALAMTVFKKDAANENKSSGNDYNTPGGDSSAIAHPMGADNEDGYSRGYIQPADAAEVVAGLNAFAPAEPLLAALPGSVDWRTKPAVVGPIKNQGGCGSCWAFGATGGMESSYGMKYGKAIVLSPQQLVDCDLKNNGCNGGWPTTAWTQYYKPNSHAWSVQETQYPYVSGTGVAKQRNTCNTNEAAGPVMVTSSSNVLFSSTWTQSGEDMVMAYIAQNGPVTIAVNSGGWGSYKSGVATTASLKCSTAVDHAVMIVGFGTEGSTNYWIIRNTWGTGWGEQGYIRLARGSNTCCVLCYVMATTTVTTSAAPTVTPTTKAPVPATTKPPTPTTKPPVTPTTKSPVTVTPTTKAATTVKPAASLSIMARGCWKDDSTRVLTKRLSAASNAILQDCAYLAYNSGFKFFGLENAGECWGGGSTYNRLGSSTGCSYPCSGNTRETCGGFWAVTMYEIVATSSLEDPNVQELLPPPTSLDLPGQCNYFKGSKSYCWECTNVETQELICQDATTQDAPSKNAFVSDNLCPVLTKLTPADICNNQQ